MAMLNGYTGAAMAFIMILRDLTFLIMEKKELNRLKKEKFDLVILLVTLVLIIGLTIITYNGPLSILSSMATLIATFGLWQKNTKNYKILGIVVGLLWLAYNVFIMSIMGIILESILVLCSIIGYIKENKNN